MGKKSRTKGRDNVEHIEGDSLGPVRWWMEMRPGDLPRVRPPGRGVPVGGPVFPTKNTARRNVAGRGGAHSNRVLEFRCCFATKLGALLPPLELKSTSTRYKLADKWVEKLVTLIDSAFWSLHLTTYAPTQSHQLGESNAPHIDSDACLSAVKDALEWAKVIDNDMRIREDHTRTEYRKGEPGLVIELRRLDA